MIQKNKWGPDYGFAGITITFNKDMAISVSSSFEGGYYFKGTYEIENNDIVMTILAEEVENDLPNIIKFKIENDSNSLYYDQCLVSFEGSKYERKYWNISSRSSVKEYIIDNKVVEVNRKRVTIKDNTKYYKTPEDDSETYLIFNYENNMTTNVIPKDMMEYFNELEIIGYYKENPEWMLAFKPIPYGSYYEMYLESDKTQKNYCWVKKEEISF